MAAWMDVLIDGWMNGCCNYVLIFATHICWKFCSVDDFALLSMMRWGKRICNLVLLMIVSMEIVLLL